MFTIETNIKYGPQEAIATTLTFSTPWGSITDELSLQTTHHSPDVDPDARYVITVHGLSLVMFLTQQYFGLAIN